MSKMNDSSMEFGIYTFGEMLTDPYTGKRISAEERIQNIIKSAKLADELGIDLFGLGEHHRLDFSVSSPAVVLSAIAQETKNIRLTSATTVLGTLDPVRVFQDFATLDLISNGRAEIIAGRGAFVESFPLFGYDLDDYEELFDEKLQLLLQLNQKERITWEGRFRSPLNDNEIAPRPKQKEIPIWRGVGGTPMSAQKAGQDGIPIVLTILAGNPNNFGNQIVTAYRQAGSAAGHGENKLKIAIASHGYIGETSEQALDEFFPYYANYIGVMMERYISKHHLMTATSRNNALAVGSPEDVVEKIVYQYELFGHHRHILQLDICQPYDLVARTIERYATQVIPKVKVEISKRH